MTQPPDNLTALSSTLKASNVTNPKTLVGVKKLPFSALPIRVCAEMAVGMQEGSLKYGRQNYRVAGVAASIYFDAALRHLVSWWEGEDIDPESGLNHVTKALTSLCVLRDGMLQGKWTDDRPVKCEDGWMLQLNELILELHDKYPEPELPYTQIPVRDNEGDIKKLSKA